MGEKVFGEMVQRLRRRFLWYVLVQPYTINLPHPSAKANILVRIQG